MTDTPPERVLLDPDNIPDHSNHFGRRSEYILATTHQSALDRIAEQDKRIAELESVQGAAAVILADRFGGYGNRKAMNAMWNFVYDLHGRHMLPVSHYDGVLQAGLRALSPNTTGEATTEGEG